MASPLRNQPAPEDQRNVIIATVLVGLIMLAWMYFMSPPPQQQAGSSGDTTQQVQQQPQTDESADTEAPPAGDTAQQAAPTTTTPETDRFAAASTLASDSITAAAAQGENRTIVVESSLYTAVLSTKGGTLQRFTLKEYKQFNQKDPIQIVDTTAGGALSVSFTTPSRRVVDSRDLYFTANTDADTIRVTDRARSITFEAPLGQGALRQTYTFHPNNYDLGLSLQQVKPATFATRQGYEIAWHGGVPYSEGGEQSELQYTGLYALNGEEVKSVTLSSTDHSEADVDGSVSWMAVKNKYFTAALMPDEPDHARGATLVGDKVAQAGSPVKVKNLTGRIRMPLPRGEADVDKFHLYAGPIDYYKLADYERELYAMVDYGWDWFEWITKPLAKWVYIPMLTYLGERLPGGGLPYGVIVILMAILIKTVVYPLTKSSYRSMAKMRELQPRMQEIKEKYDDDPQKQQEEMMKMYRETGVNPIGGCLPMFLQYPILISLYQFIPKSIQLRQKSFLWAADLSAPDKILQLPFEIPFYGDYVAGFTLLMGLAMIVTMRVQSTPSSGGGQAKMFMYAMPAVIFFIFNRFASALSLYYLFYNLVTAAQQKWINMQLEQEKDEDGNLTNGRGTEADAESKGFFQRMMEKAEEAQKEQRQG